MPDLGPFSGQTWGLKSLLTPINLMEYGVPMMDAKRARDLAQQQQEAYEEARRGNIQMAQTGLYGGMPEFMQLPASDPRNSNYLVNEYDQRYEPGNPNYPNYVGQPNYAPTSTPENRQQADKDAEFQPEPGILGQVGGMIGGLGDRVRNRTTIMDRLRPSPAQEAPKSNRGTPPTGPGPRDNKVGTKGGANRQRNETIQQSTTGKTRNEPAQQLQQPTLKGLFGMQEEQLGGYDEQAAHDLSSLEANQQNDLGYYGQMAVNQRNSFAGMENTVGNQYNDLIGAGQGRYDQLMAQLEGAGDQERQDINESYDDRSRGIGQQMNAAGMGATTVGSTLRQGNQRERTNSLGRLDERLRGERMGYGSQLSGDVLNLQGARAGAMNNLAGQRYGMESGLGAGGSQLLSDQGHALSGMQSNVMGGRRDLQWNTDAAQLDYMTGVNMGYPSDTTFYNAETGYGQRAGGMYSQMHPYEPPGNNGWAGAAGGLSAGAAIGTTIFPGIGTAIGAAVGGAAGYLATKD